MVVGPSGRVSKELGSEAVDKGAGRRKGHSAAALGAFLLISILMFGIPVLPHLTHSYLGNGADPADPDAFFWFLNWWPYAIGHGLNPFVTHAVYAPCGLDVATATSVPAASLAALPVTLTLGPVAAFNLLMLLAPALAGWCAFLLCRYVTNAFWPSIAGGYLFGFSTYEIAHLTAHLNLSLVFLVPLVILLLLRHVRGELGPNAFVWLLALILTAQFMLSTEVFATMTVFGAIALLVAAVLGPHEGRHSFREIGIRIALAYGLAAVALSPYLYYFFQGSVYPTRGVFDADLANVVIPTTITAVGGQTFASVSRKFVGNFAETAAYVGLPLLGIFAMFVWSRGRSKAGKFLSIMVAVVLVASLGSPLRIRGHSSIPLPWALVRRFPMIRFALPDRLTVYLFLLLGLITAIWLAATANRRVAWLKWALVVANSVALFPNLAGGYWHGSTTVPSFFADGTYRNYLTPGETVLVIPAGRAGADAQLWQIEAGMSFRLAGGYLVRDTFSDPLCPLDRALVTGNARRYPVGPDALGQLRALLAARGVQTVMLYGPLGESWRPVLAGLGLTPVEVGGVTLYQIGQESGA